MGDLGDDMAMGSGCCTPARDDNVLMALFVYRPRVSKLGSRRLIQFPPEMDEIWLRDGLAKLGQICELPNWQRIVVLCVHNTTSALNS